MGAQLRVYKQKINTAQTTKKITKAMELIAASRIQKAMARVRASSPFARAVTRAVSAVSTHSNIDHPLTSEREVISRSAVVIFASDRGLAGAFNSQILREGLELAELLRQQGKEPVFYLVGRKAVGFFQFRRMQAAAEWTGDTDTPHFHTAEEIAAKHAATQKAMKSASDNADKLIKTYTTLANNARQSEITQQISEIVGGADALSSAK